MYVARHHMFTLSSSHSSLLFTVNLSYGTALLVGWLYTFSVQRDEKVSENKESSCEKGTTGNENRAQLCIGCVTGYTVFPYYKGKIVTSQMQFFQERCETRWHFQVQPFLGCSCSKIAAKNTI